MPVVSERRQTIRAGNVLDKKSAAVQNSCVVQCTMPLFSCLPARILLLSSGRHIPPFSSYGGILARPHGRAFFGIAPVKSAAIRGARALDAAVGSRYAVV